MWSFRLPYELLWADVLWPLLGARLKVINAVSSHIQLRLGKRIGWFLTDLGELL